MARIVLIDDEPRLLATFARFLQGAGHEVHAGEQFSTVEGILHREQFEVLIADILMPGTSGLEVLKEVIERGCQEPVVLITGEPNLATASEAVRLGAFDYVAKPVTKDKLLEVVARALRHVGLLRERDRARRTEMEVRRNLAVIGESAAVLTHEIKTPITNLNMALRAVADKLDLEHRVVIQELVDRLLRVEKLMQTTLSFSKPLDLKLVPTRVADLFGRLTKQFEGLPDHPRMAIELRTAEDLPSVPLDPERLEEVLVNLVQNAAEACGRHGRVVLSAERIEPQGIRIEVEDDGPGIPPERREEVFKLFHTSKEKGAGLGLAICRKVIEAHGGTIQLVDGRLPGACFRIELGTGQ
jgi:signal transduction histidine kinase